MLKSNYPEHTVIDKVAFDDDLDADGYAWAWAMSHFLGEKKKDAFFRYLTEVSKLGPLETMNESKQKLLFESSFGSDHSKLSSEMMVHLRKLPYVDPIENLTHYVVLYRYTQNGSTYVGCGVTASRTAVDKMREELKARLPASVQLTAQFEVKPFPTRTQASNFAQSLRNAR
jgi:hypothetical protein